MRFLVMDLPTNFIESCLLLPPAVIAYHAGRRLLELRPNKAVIECNGCGFDLDGFVEAGHAGMTLLADLGHSQVVTGWRGCASEEPMIPAAMSARCLTGETGCADKVANGLVRLEWQGKVLEALRLRWTEMMGAQHVCFLIAESRTVAEAFYTTVCEWSALPHGEVLVFEQGSWRKDRALFNAIGASSFTNLVLAPGLKEALRDDVSQFFARAQVYQQYRIPWKRGVLLLGPPGNGKTHAVKALSHELGVPALYVRSLEPQGMFHGSEHSNISSVFEFARKTAPCLLILEDIDALLKPGNRSFLLNELDGFADNTGVCVVATTNYPERLDASILERPSRFDRKYDFALPGRPERMAYLRLWNDQQAPELRLTDTGMQTVADATDGFSFAYMKELCLAAVMAWMNSGAQPAMDAVAAAQAQALMAQMRTQPTEDPEAPEQLTPRQRFRKLMQTET